MCIAGLPMLLPLFISVCTRPFMDCLTLIGARCRDVNIFGMESQTACGRIVTAIKVGHNYFTSYYTKDKLYTSQLIVKLIESGENLHIVVYNRLVYNILSLLYWAYVLLRTCTISRLRK